MTIIKQTKIITSFKRFSDDQLEGHALAVAAAMTGNSNFPDSLPVLADLNNNIKLFSDGLALAKTRENLVLLLLKLANYCTHIVEGDRPKLASSGSAPTTENNTAQTLGSPENFTMQPGNNFGEAYVFINSVPNAKSYLFLYHRLTTRPASTPLTAIK